MWWEYLYCPECLGGMGIGGRRVECYMCDGWGYFLCVEQNWTDMGVMGGPPSMEVTAMATLLPESVSEDAVKALPSGFTRVRLEKLNPIGRKATWHWDRIPA
jgi:hypothetical protein